VSSLWICCFQSKQKNINHSFPTRWIAFAANVSTALNLTSKSLPRFWGAAFAGSSLSTTGFSPQAIIDQGILNTSSWFAYIHVGLVNQNLLINDTDKFWYIAGYPNTDTVDPFAWKLWSPTRLDVKGLNQRQFNRICW
jgi:hypothetical protein